MKKIHPSRISFIKIYGVGIALLLWSAIYYAFLDTRFWVIYVSPDFGYIAQYLTVAIGATSNNNAVVFWIAVTFLVGVISVYLTRRHRHWLTFLAFILLLALSVLALRSIGPFRARSVIFLTAATAASGIVAVLLADFYRRSYRYYITNLRIAMIRKFLTYNELYMRYENIVDVDVNISLLGRLFSFGNVIPVTAAGVGVGQNLQGKESVNGSISVKGTDVPRAMPSECFWGIKRPYVIRNTVVDYVTKSSSSYELKQIQSELRAKAL